MIALFKRKCKLNALELSAIATILLSQGRGSQNNSTDPHRVIPKRVLPPATLFTIITNVVHNLTTRTKLLHANEFRHMCFCRVRLPLILGGLEIIKYIKYIVRVRRQNILERSHKTYINYIYFLFTNFTKSLIIFMVSARHEDPTRSATSPALTNGFLIRGNKLIFRETRLAPKMFVT